MSKIKTKVSSRITSCVTDVQECFKTVPDNPIDLVDALVEASELFEAAAMSMLGGALHGLKDFAKEGTTDDDVRILWRVTIDKVTKARQHMFGITMREVYKATGVNLTPSINEKLREELLEELGND